MLYVCTHLLPIPFHAVLLWNASNDILEVFERDKNRLAKKDNALQYGERTIMQKLMFLSFSLFIVQLSFFDTYTDFIFSSIALKEGEYVYFAVSLAFMCLSIIGKLIVTAYGFFRGTIFKDDKHDLLAIITAFDYISVLDVSED